KKLPKRVHLKLFRIIEKLAPSLEVCRVKFTNVKLAIGFFECHGYHILTTLKPREIVLDRVSFVPEKYSGEQYMGYWITDLVTFFGVHAMHLSHCRFAKNKGVFNNNYLASIAD
ncbi:hypothetical protein PFISCL1PPCAC_3207, partial [Pristionchus fissidentatus]